jgi:hypothetical protein
MAAIAFYVLVYTMVLKRRTEQNIVIGGAAGCFPVLVGWAAVAVVLGRLPVRAEGCMDLNEDEACVCQCLSRCVVAVLCNGCMHPAKLSS